MWLEKIILTKEDNLHYIIIYYSQNIRVRKRDEGRYLEKLLQNVEHYSYESKDHSLSMKRVPFQKSRGRKISKDLLRTNKQK